MSEDNNNKIIRKNKKSESVSHNTIIRKKNRPIIDKIIITEIEDDTENVSQHDGTNIITEDNHNKIIRKNKKNTPSESSTHNHVIRKKDQDCEPIPEKIIIKKVTKIETDIEDVSQFDGTDIITEYSNITKNSPTDTDLTKEEMIEKVEYQRDVLIKNRDKYAEKDYMTKLSTIDSLLSRLKVGWIDTGVAEMNNNRIKIDKIVLEKKIPEKQFKTKIDLTGDHDDKDPSIGALTGGRKFFENQKSYQPLPKELIKIAPKKDRGFGNQPLPADILKTINFS